MAEMWDEERIVVQAKNDYETEDVVIDDEVAIRPAMGGYWVRTWVWVSEKDVT